MRREYVLLVGIDTRDESAAMGIHLRKVGPGLFLGQNRPLTALDKKRRATLPSTSTATSYIIANTTPPENAVLSKFREFGAEFFSKVQMTALCQTLFGTMQIAAFSRILTPGSGYLIQGKVEWTDGQLRCFMPPRREILQFLHLQYRKVRKSDNLSLSTARYKPSFTLVRSPS